MVCNEWGPPHSDYGTEQLLVQEIKQFIHKYVGISSLFEEIATFYVLFTWIYDCFNELPYLRALGDYGCGKSRFLRVIGSLCYKPIFTAGATSISPIFRIINEFNGTFILDEADLRVSDTKSEIVKILNSGFAKGTPVMRSEEKKGGGFDVKVFNVYCPKIIATRERFYDKALESRFLIEEMDSSNLRDDILINLPDTFEEEATVIRNKLLMWRFKNHGVKKIDNSQIDKALEPRLNQIIMPLITVINDEGLKQRIKEFTQEHNKQLIQDRGFTVDADVLEVILELRSMNYEQISIKLITDNLNAKLGEKDKKYSAKKIGLIVRNNLKLRPHKTSEGYVLEISEYSEKLERLSRKYDINAEHIESIEKIFNEKEITF